GRCIGCACSPGVRPRLAYLARHEPRAVRDRAWSACDRHLAWLRSRENRLIWLSGVEGAHRSMRRWFRSVLARTAEPTALCLRNRGPISAPAPSRLAHENDGPETRRCTMFDFLSSDSTLEHWFRSLSYRRPPRPEPDDATLRNWAEGPTIAISR